MQEVIKICKSFLWSAQACNHEPGNIDWEDVCCHKQEGGVGCRDVVLWNIANMGNMFRLWLPNNIIFGLSGLILDA